ncbi:MAG: phosphotransferase enzyme family protein [Sciscionella sp.]
MPKDRQTIDKDQLDSIVFDIASRIGDVRPRLSSQGFANYVYIGDEYVYKLVPLLADGYLEYAKERKILTLLGERLPELSRKHLPQLIYSEPHTENVGCVDVYTKLPGVSVDNLSANVCVELGHFLHDLHGCVQHQFITEFEGEQSGPGFRDYVILSVDKFVAKLQASVNIDLLELVKRAKTQAIKLVADVDEPKLVTLHKDLFRENILVMNEHITGIIDWEAAQSGPREWDFAILRQRFPNKWRTIYAAYHHRLDDTLLDLCGLVQSLRFWKSFPDQEKFVKQQVDYLRQIMKEP